MPREAPCNRHDARGRLTKAQGFLLVAEVALGSEDDAAASNAVLAAVAAADAICCTLFGRRSADDDHRAATRLVSTIDEFGTEAAGALARVLDVKHKAQYDAAPVSPSEALRAVRGARRLVALAQNVLAG